MLVEANHHLTQVSLSIIYHHENNDTINNKLAHTHAHSYRDI
jgi:hypothetical protein